MLLGKAKLLKVISESLVAKAFLLFAFFFLLSNQSIAEESNSHTLYSPNAITRQQSSSVKSKTRLKDAISFVYNRGEGAVQYEQFVLDFLNPKKIVKLPGYSSAKGIRIRLKAYQFNNANVLRAIEDLFEWGDANKIPISLQCLVDSKTSTPLKIPAYTQRRRWSASQKAYYLNQYDLNEDGKVTKADVDRFNDRLEESFRVWARLKKLRKKYTAARVELITNPYEVVPSRPEDNYTKLTHVKELSLDFLIRKKWKRQQSFFGSANFTHTGLSGRITRSKENIANYFAGDDYDLTSGTQGHIQFGALIRDPELIKHLEGPMENWLGLNRKKKHFDEAALPEKQWPRIIFDNPNSNLGPSRLQTFFSEGNLKSWQKPLDIIWAVSQILTKPEIQLLEFRDSHFVYTHRDLALLLRSHMEAKSFEDFSVYVDGSMATQDWSVLPDLLFRSQINNNEGVLSGKSIVHRPKPRAELNWQENAFVYGGHDHMRGPEGDKLHSKMSYYKYRDLGSGELHHVVAWGSANKSNNAGKLNADMMFVLDSTEAWVEEVALKYFAALRDDDRMQNFGEAYLSTHFSNLFAGSATFTNKFVKRVAALLSRKNKLPRSLNSIVDTLIDAGAANPRGHNFLAILEWYRNFDFNKRKLGWTEWDLIYRYSDPSFLPEDSFLHDFLKHSMHDSTLPFTRAYAEVQNLEENLFRVAAPDKKPQPSKLLANIRSKCEGFLDRVGRSLSATGEIQK